MTTRPESDFTHAAGCTGCDPGEESYLCRGCGHWRATDRMFGLQPRLLLHRLPPRHRTVATRRGRHGHHQEDARVRSAAGTIGLRQTVTPDQLTPHSPRRSTG
jgi:hypothetical protein